jgi:hypothetical protein
MFRACSLLFFALAAAPSLLATEFTGAHVITSNGYEGCIELSNPTTRVVLEPNLGGRVLQYQFHGVEALYQDPKHDGRLYDPANTEGLHPPGGRFDIGPEFTVPKHPQLFYGKWTAEITGHRSARLTSPKDLETGVQLIRDFRLEATTSHLSCTQTIINISSKRVRYCHWSRTFADEGGICLVPLKNPSRYPLGYAVYTASEALNFHPDAEPNVRVRDGILEIIGVPSRPKWAFDSDAGWMGHVGKNNLLFLKKFPVLSPRVYGELGSNTAAIFYREAMAELEPIGPMEDIGPGARSAFTEDWWLYDMAMPADRTVDLVKVRELVLKSVAGK